MLDTIDTINDVILDKKQILNKLICEKEEIIGKLCEKHEMIKNFKWKIEKLEADVKSLYAIEANKRQVGNYGAQNGCNLSPGNLASDSIKQ